MARIRITPLNKYEKQGQSKIVNSYGAVGTLIQTINNGSLIIDNFDKWPYYRDHLRQIRTGPEGLINNPAFIKEDRLLKRLKIELQCNSLTGIFKMPENKSDNRNGVLEENKVISAHFFPMWFYCPKCGNMNYYVNNPEHKQFPFCCKLPKEQFSFVLVSENGSIADIPWAKFLNADLADEQIQFEIADTKDINLVLKYSTGGSAEHMETKKITATINGQTITKSLATLPAKTFIEANGNEYKMAIRQGNNLCFVKTLASLYIPKYEIPDFEISLMNGAIGVLEEMGAPPTPEGLLNVVKGKFKNTNTNTDHIKFWLNEQQNSATAETGEDELQVTEEEYKFKEFDFIVNHESDYIEAYEDISFKKFECNKIGIQNLYRINKLKVTQVQTGYTRLKPEGDLQKIYSEPNILFYPGIEMKGEGMLMEMNTNQLNAFLNNPNNNAQITDLEALVHSLSHSIMKELEFECGYPLNSLKERLYFGKEQINGVDQVKYAGVLIYSASGAESSFGGIAALFETFNNKLKIITLIKNACERAQDCPNDPICIDENTNGNKGVCYSCNLIPETSCENFNQSLNRKQLIAFYQQYGTN